jgi:hypothetical protein
MSNRPKGWNNQDINFGMSEESEKMLIKDRVTSSCRVVKGRRKVTIC